MTSRSPALSHDVAGQLAREEYARCLRQLRSLDAGAWATPSECAPWTVRDVVAHMVGMLEMSASMRETVRLSRVSTRAAKRSGRTPLDEMTDLQVRARADWSSARLTERFGARMDKAAAGRRRTPVFVRTRKLPQVQDVGGAKEFWTIGFLTDVIMTRDPWMHRVDISTAVGAPLELSAEHDGVLLADVVAEWADRHGKDFHLTLTGPAGGTWAVGENGPAISADAVEFARVLSGRRSTTLTLDDLFSTEVPF